jgi:hypothetical protein
LKFLGLKWQWLLLFARRNVRHQEIPSNRPVDVLADIPTEYTPLVKIPGVTTTGSVEEAGGNIKRCMRKTLGKLQTD